MPKLDRKVNKLFNIDIKSVDEENRQVTFCFSDGKPDRMNEIVDQASWDIKNYESNPLILWGHDPSQPENVLGQGISLDLNQGGKSYITAQFDEAETNPRADMVFRQLIKRTLRCVSAGFINHTFEWEDDIPVLKDNELLEVSIVPIPANPRAVALALQEGSLSKKDAEWMIKSMKTETDYIEKVLAKDDETVVEKDMEELTAKVTALTDLMGKLADNQNTLTEAVTALTEVVKPVEETDEEKTAREAKEAEAAKAKEEADAKAEAERKAAEEEEAKRQAEADAAKGGSDDQSGAATDELEDDAELTPELQALIDAELEAVAA